MSQETRTNAMGYARAVYELALENWQKSLPTIQKNLADANLLAKLDDLQTSFSERKKLLDKQLPPDLPEQTKNFFYTLLKDGNLRMLDDVVGNLLRMASKGANAQVAVVTTATPLTAAEKRQFKTKLAAQYGKEVEVDFKVDQSIIGGVIVQVGDKILDGSINTKLNSAREKLVKAA